MNYAGMSPVSGSVGGYDERAIAPTKSEQVVDVLANTIANLVSVRDRLLYIVNGVGDVAGAGSPSPVASISGYAMNTRSLSSEIADLTEQLAMRLGAAI